MATKTNDYRISSETFSIDGTLIDAKKKTAIRIDGITKSDVSSLTMKIEDGNLVIKNSDGESIKVKNYSSIKYIKTDYVKKGKKEYYNLTNIIDSNLVDNTTNPITKIVTNSKKKTATLNGTVYNDEISASAYDGSYKLYINANSGNDNIVGSDKRDIINAGNGNDTIEGSKSNDTITGGKGANTIHYANSEFGTDTINLTKGETLNLNFDDTENMFYQVNPLNKKDIAITNGEDFENGTVILKNYATKNTGAKVLVNGHDLVTENLLETIDTTNYFTKSKTKYTGTMLADSIDASELDGLTKTIKKGKKKITVAKEITDRGVEINSGNGNDIVIGSKYSDIIKGGNGNDTITGGTGNDKLYGGTGANTFVFEGDFGKDTIYDENVSAKNTLIFDNLDNCSIKKSGNNLIIYKDSDNYVTLSNYYSTKLKHKATYTITVGGEDEVSLGEFLTDKVATVSGTGSISGTANDDIITVANKKSATISTGKGDDLITYSKGGKTMYFYQGDGNDSIESGGGTDVLKFQKNTTVTAELVYNADATANLVIHYGDEGDTVTLLDYKTNDNRKYYYIGKKKYAISSLIHSGENKTIQEYSIHYDGTMYNDTIKDSFESVITINAGDGDDSIDARNDIINGGSGNDYISEVNSNVRGGDGNDVIRNFSSGNDTTSSCEIYGDSGNDIIINEERAYINNIYGNEGNDSITNYGTVCGSIVGGVGDDSITIDKDSSCGSINFSKGDGNDILYLNSESNHLKFDSSISDFVYYRKNNDMVIKYNSGIDSVTIKDYFINNKAVYVNGSEISDDTTYSCTYDYTDDCTVTEIEPNEGGYNLIFDSMNNLTYERISGEDDLIVKYGTNKQVTLKKYFIQDDDSNMTINGHNISDLIMDNVNDIYDYSNGCGNTLVSSNGGNDSLIFDTLDNLTFARYNGSNDLIISDENDNDVTLYDYFSGVVKTTTLETALASSSIRTVSSTLSETILGTTTDDDLEYSGSDYSNKTINALAGDDVIYVIGDNNFITGGKGNDYISVYSGEQISQPNTVIFNKGDGNDYLKIRNFCDIDTDDDEISIGEIPNNTVIKFADVTLNDLTYIRKCNDLIIKYSDSDSITIPYYFVAQENSDFIHSTNTKLIIKDSANTIKDISDVLSISNYTTISKTSEETINGTVTDDYLYYEEGNGYSNKTINALDGDDEICISGDNNTITGGKGNDDIEITYAGEDYVDSIDELETQTNTVIFNKGDGNDSVYIYAEEVYSYDGEEETSLGVVPNKTIIKFADTLLADFKYIKKGEDLIIKYSDTDSVTINNYYYDPEYEGDGNNTKTLILKDRANNVKDITDISTITNYTTISTTSEETINGTATDDNIRLYEDEYSNKTINALAGDDEISVTGYDNTIIGGKGNDDIEVEYQDVHNVENPDTLETQTNTVVFSKGDGNDTVSVYSGSVYAEEYGPSVGNRPSQTILKFSDVTLNDLTYIQKGDDLIIKYSDSDSVTLYSYYNDSEYDWDENYTRPTLIIKDSAGYTKDITETSYISNLSTISTTSEETIYGTVTDDNLDIDECEYFNKTINAQSGDDEISVLGNHNTIIGGKGNDEIEVSYEGLSNVENLDELETQTNIVVFSKGDGNDTVSVYAGSVYSDDEYENCIGRRPNETILKFEDTSFDDFVYIKKGDDLIIKYSDSDTVTLYSYYNDSEYVWDETYTRPVLMIKDRSGAVKDITEASYISNLPIVSASSEETIVGTSTDDDLKYNDDEYSNKTINSLAGDDYISLSGDNNIIVAGKGNDEIDLSYDEQYNVEVYEDLPTKTNTLIFNKGDGNDILNINVGEAYSGDDGLDSLGTMPNETILKFSDTALSNITYLRRDDDLIIKYTDKDSITISDYYTEYSNPTLIIKDENDSSIDITDTSSISDVEIISNTVEEIITGTSNDDSFNFDEYSNKTINALTGDDSISLGGDNNMIIGGKGNDYIDISYNGLSSVESLDDLATQTNTVMFNKGDGNDIINVNVGEVYSGFYETYLGARPNNTILKFSDSMLDDLIYIKKDDDLVIKYSDNDSVTINDYFYEPEEGEDYLKPIYTLQTKDEYSVKTINGQDISVLTAKNIEIIGSSEDDIINADDMTSGSIFGGAGDDTYNITLNQNTNLLISDIDYNDDSQSSGGDADILNINANIKDISLMFDVYKDDDGNWTSYYTQDSDNDTTRSDSLLIFNNKDTLTLDNLSNYMNGSGTGILEINSYFDGDGTIETITAKDSNSGEYSVIQMDSWIGNITSQVATWMDTHTDYTSSMDVFNSSNSADKTSLLAIYQNSTYNQ